MANKFTSFRFQIPSDSFTNVPGALLYFYEADTLNLVTVYANEGLSTPLTNPVEADGFGLFPDIFLVPDLYDVVAKDEDDVLIWDSLDYEVQDIPVLDPNYFSLVDGEYVPGISVNAQTGTAYTIQDSDRASIITFNNSGVGTITLPAPTGSDFPNKWFAYVSNIGTGTFTINSVANINGTASYTLPAGSFTLLVSNGTTYSAGASSNLNEIFMRAGGTLTIATGAITIGGFSQYILDTEGGAATDDLDTINGVSNGKLLVLRTTNDGRDVVLKHNTGNIFNPALQDITLGKTQDIVFMRYDSNLSKWVVIAYQNAATIVPPSILSRIVAAGVNFNGTGTVAINSDYYVASITDNGTGDYTVNFDAALPNATYEITGTARFVIGGGVSYGGIGLGDGQIKSTTQCQVRTFSDDGGVPDATEVSVVVFVNQ